MLRKALAAMKLLTSTALALLNSFFSSSLSVSSRTLLLLVSSGPWSGTQTCFSERALIVLEYEAFPRLPPRPYTDPS